MKILALITCVLLMSLSVPAHAEYQTYVQSNRTGVGHNTEVLMLVQDPATPDSKKDIAMCRLTLSPGQTQTKVVSNKFFPGRKYSFSITFKRPVITTVVVVSENGQELFRSDQSLASWEGF